MSSKGQFRMSLDSSASVAPDAFTDKVIEVTETTEEPVVSKTARVVEEVVVGKQAEERTETVRDTVRREAVEVEGTARAATGKTGETDRASRVSDSPAPTGKA